MSDSPIHQQLEKLISSLPAASKPEQVEESIEKSTSNATSMDVDAAAAPAQTGEKTAPVKEKRPAWAGRAASEPLPEADVYIRLLVIVGLMDNKNVEQVGALCMDSLNTSDLGVFPGLRVCKGYSCAHPVVEPKKHGSHRRQGILLLCAMCRAVKAGRGSPTVSPVSLRPDTSLTVSMIRLLLAAQSTAFLRHDEDLQATVINCLLRNYFNSHLYDQADKLVSKITWPESAGNPQSARYLFYLGRVRAIQLNYSSSHECLLNAVRRAPAAHVAPGFYQTVHKFFIVVELLMGDIPERSLFRQPVLRKALVPYFQIVQGKSTP